MTVYQNILITGGAGFVGSNTAISFKKDLENTRITVLDNLKRRGSELALTRLQIMVLSFSTAISVTLKISPRQELLICSLNARPSRRYTPAMIQVRHTWSTLT